MTRSPDRRRPPRPWAVALVMTTALALTSGLAACGTLTGIDDYVVDCAKAPCGTGSDASTDVDLRFEGALIEPVCRATLKPVLPKCTEVEFAAQDQTSPASPRLITFPTKDQEAPYFPNCMVIKAGQSVTWRGKLTSHPLIPREDSTIDNPILTVSAGTEATFTFGCAGDFNFSCRNHQDNMLGTIRVVP